MQLSLRPTIIAGDKIENDYCVIHDGRGVGRIRLANERSWRGAVWTWNVNPPLPIPPWCNGTADSLEAAKAEFKAAWERFYASLTPERIRRWHLIEDMGRSNDEPIKTPDGKTLRTLRDAAEYVLALPPKTQAQPAWQQATLDLKNAAEREKAWMWFARSGMMHGPDPPSIGNPGGKGHRWGKRRLARER